MRKSGCGGEVDSNRRRAGRRALAALVLVAAVTGCASSGSSATPASAGRTSTTYYTAASPRGLGPGPGRGDSRPRSSRSPATSAGWTFTTYYTAVERFHSGAPKRVRGCRRRECSHGRDLLGWFPRDFVAAVKDEGTGRITRGPHRGAYLSWSYDTGFWLDTVPVDTDGRRLRPFVTAAADRAALPKRTRFRIMACGREQEDGSAIDARACARLKASTWIVLDAFTPGLGGRRHIDLYVGEEKRARFPDTSPYSITTSGSVIRRLR
jgi:hypothetical protein